MGIRAQGVCFNANAEIWLFHQLKHQQLKHLLVVSNRVGSFDLNPDALASESELWHSIYWLQNTLASVHSYLQIGNDSSPSLPFISPTTSGRAMVTLKEAEAFSGHQL